MGSLMILAGNITPIDVITHIPILCEENDIPYVYVPKKEELGSFFSIFVLRFSFLCFQKVPHRQRNGPLAVSWFFPKKTLLIKNTSVQSQKKSKNFQSHSDHHND